MNNKENYALKFVLLFGIVSLFGDLTYESARSITGPYLGFLGASATAIGVVAGLGEFVSYAFRLLWGYLSDRTKRYWTIIILGYTINLLAVPSLALAGRWEVASLLIILERFGKSLRTPARDAMLSHATKITGRGWGFGLHEALDQLGAITGPLIMAVLLYHGLGYRFSFAILIIPALFALIILFFVRNLYPHPEEMEMEEITLKVKGMDYVFWFYLVGTGLIAAGFADFPLIAFHLNRLKIVPWVWIPILYSMAMGMDALSALFFGRLYDWLGFRVLIYAICLCTFFSPFLFLGDFYSAFFGIMLWGMGLGIQESIMRAVIASLVPSDKRATGYGIFNTFYGMAWFIGSAFMGMLYDISLFFLVVFSVSIQLISLPFFIRVAKRI